MTAPKLVLGAVFLADFPTHEPTGREQQGPRPAILVGLPTSAGMPRYPVLMLAPVTTHRAQEWAANAPLLYPILPAAAGGLSADSVVLTDQTRALDAHRLMRYLGSLTPREYAPIRHALKLSFGF